MKHSSVSMLKIKETSCSETSAEMSSLIVGKSDKTDL